jgi:hypothetical protein
LVDPVGNAEPYLSVWRHVFAKLKVEPAADVFSTFQATLVIFRVGKIIDSSTQWQEWKRGVATDYFGCSTINVWPLGLCIKCK